MIHIHWLSERHPYQLLHGNVCHFNRTNDLGGDLFLWKLRIEWAIAKRVGYWKDAVNENDLDGWCMGTKRLHHKLKFWR